MLLNRDFHCFPHMAYNDENGEEARSNLVDLLDYDWVPRRGCREGGGMGHCVLADMAILGYKLGIECFMLRVWKATEQHHAFNVFANCLLRRENLDCIWIFVDSTMAKGSTFLPHSHHIPRLCNILNLIASVLTFCLCSALLSCQTWVVLTLDNERWRSKASSMWAILNAGRSTDRGRRRYGGSE